MGSRIMHYCISSLLANKLDISNRNEFMLGGIAPDIHGLMGVPKGVTHFKDIDADGKSHINYMRFYNMYKDVIKEQPFYLGYLCHLISDVAYLDTYFKIVPRSVPDSKWKEKLQTSYRDFQRLNGRIIKEYSLTLHEHVLPSINIQGYNADFIPALLDEMRKDFQIDEGLMNETLELFKDDKSEITDYINKSVEQCLEFVSTVGIDSYTNG
ncbi:zinc dependent phospholipase C family protein [Paenibacillus dakarensis]|uniref:zinc dependent phospholipase C family protein n=1 Tax=Paenibacillus dakarensis TaxID=1527293 RepID=UPI0006D55169|nr:zinc dependent phospholipase C family protein [Paenibacillus dakarensis]